MNLLLDAHVWFWALQSPDKLGPACRAFMEDPQTTLTIATISTLELGQLVVVGKIEIKGTLDAWVHRGIQSLGAQTAEMTHRIALLAYGLPGNFHKDPTDRILVATAIDQGLALATADERILQYPHVMALDARK